MSDEKKPFTVRDRRHFTPDGRVRADPAPAEAAPGRSEPTPRAAETPPGPARDAPGEPTADFAGFLLSLGAQAGMLLERASTAPEEAAEDLRNARYLISVLEMLRAKTEDRRTPEEERVLEGLLYELRMGYLARAGAAGA
ncbi:MAG: DUF1844 domain-containing protein [Acidobacteria bacterium]|nr:DUF1844 domain-containing protein [Acidobacteriota bacterium]